jgi:hypothetical protein
MEALIILISEFILLLVMAGILFLFLGILTVVLGGINLGVRTRTKTNKIIWIRRIGITFTLIFIIAILISLVINFFLFEPTARVVLDQVKTRTGIEVTFDSAKGNIFSGVVQMTEVKIKRENHLHSQFDLQAEKIFLNMDMTAIINFKAVIEDLKVTGMKGSFQRVGKVRRLKPRKSFIIENFILEDVDIQFSDMTRGEEPVTASVKITSMQSTPFRSQLSIYDIFFNSIVKGTLEETSSLAIEKKEWTLDQLPLTLIGQFLGGPFRLISGGNVFIKVKNQWHDRGKSVINMDWHLVIRDIKAKVPEGYPDTGIKRKMADRVVSYINEYSREFSFGFSLDIDEQTFKDLVSFEGTGFQEAIRKKMSAIIAVLSGKAKEKLKEIGKKGVQKFKNFLNKRRKKEE